MQKSVAFLYTKNERSEREIKKTVPFTITLKVINLHEDTKNLYSKNCKTDEGNSRWHKEMERYTVFLDWKNQYCQNDIDFDDGHPNWCKVILTEV